jgi:DNA (cytosine-5)-methyltransferase 1
VLDTEAFGLPQRRRRLFLLAAKDGDPWDVLLSGDRSRPADPDWDKVACGFYWTEGMRALGWAVNATPPLKGGSTVGVPSPPAVLFPNREVATPDLRDAERLQGFPAGWTEPAEEVARTGFRWHLVGNSVSVPVSAWIGRKLRNPRPYDRSRDKPLRKGGRWPNAAWGTEDGAIFSSDATTYPCWLARPDLEDFLRFPVKPLSEKAARGFLKRTHKGSLRFKDGFIEAIENHIERLGGEVPVWTPPVPAVDPQLTLI